MITNEQINNIIHNDLIPIQQIFRNYEKLSHNPSFYFNGEIFRECALKIEEIIEILREFARNNSKGVKNDKTS